MNHISSAAAFIKQEFFQVLPPTIYFLATFNIVVLTTAMVLQEFEVQISGHAAATLLALVVAKVVLVVDKIKYVRRFDGKPLVYPVFFKAFTYSLVVFLFRLLEHWIPGLFETGTIAGATQHLLDGVIWRFFFMAQIWIFFLFIVYFTFAALIEVFGLTTQYLIAAFFREHPATIVDRS
ncbi:MAG: hypothetical protein V3S73_07970 [Gammaproteobacteria bacterium]